MFVELERGLVGVDYAVFRMVVLSEPVDVHWEVTGGGAK